MLQRSEVGARHSETGSGVMVMESERISLGGEYKSERRERRATDRHFWVGKQGLESTSSLDDEDE